ncbi:hypothetical protein NCS52_00000600 [Fusarium sp. LHS14.1]|nr:hypothetical protein NCS52_00000600 [Fusarium sp. LHS14.1]
MLVLHDLPYSPTKYRSLQKPQRSNKRPGYDTQHVAKKRKLDHPSRPPSHFWDNLSQLPLTKNALRELNRRTTAEPRFRLHPEDRYRRPRTRHAVATRRKTQPLPAQEFLYQCSSADQAQLRRFARHGGPNLKDLRGYRQAIDPEMSSSQSSLGRRKRGSRSPSKANTTTTRSTGPYDRAFQQHLIDHNIFPDRYEYPDGSVPPEPENIDDICRALEQPRASLSPSLFSQDDFKKFKRTDAHATKESQVATSVMPIIGGDPGDTKCIAGDVPFTNLEHLTDGSLVCAKPDLYYGAQPEQLHPKLRQELNNFVVPSTQSDLPIMPNNFVEIKGPDGSLSVATRQALYDGACGARGYHSVQALGAPELPFDNRAYTLTSTYHGGQLKMFAHHPIQPLTPGEQPGYVMTQLKAFAMTNDINTFRQGAAAFRNGRDWAKTQRDQAIAQANEKVSGLRIHNARTTPHSGTIEAARDLNEGPSTSVLEDSDTSADELSLDFERPVKRSRSPEKQPSTVASTPTNDADQKGKVTLATSKQNAFMDGRRFNLTLPNRAGDDEV